jgi:hypothetical protein
MSIRAVHVFRDKGGDLSAYIAAYIAAYTAVHTGKFQDFDTNML